MSPEHHRQLKQKVDERDAAHRLLGRLTTGTVLGALAGVGVFGYVSAATIPGNAPATTQDTTASTAGTTSSSRDDESSSSDDSSSSSGLSTSSGSVSSSSGSNPIAVTGGSR